MERKYMKDIYIVAAKEHLLASTEDFLRMLLQLIWV